MIEHISNHNIDTVVDSNNNKSTRKHSTNNLIKLIGNRIRGKATSLNDLSDQFQNQTNRKEIKKLNSSVEESSCKVINCMNCQEITKSKQQVEFKYYKDCCHNCSTQIEEYDASKKISTTSLMRNLSCSYSDQIVPLNKQKMKLNKRLNDSYSNSSRSSFNEFDNFPNLTFYKQCNVS